MSKKQLEAQLLADAQEAGFTIINGLIYSASACERMEALAKFAMIRENRAIEPVFQELERVKKDAIRYERIRENWLDCDELNLHGRLSVIDNTIDAAINKEQL